ncbi:MULTISPECIES: restriction endonuclease subunit S [Bacillus]|uniref:restriction endonuclease subunit S n=1 Tax=Bacillus TaxID=1386 RepID=UPI0008528FDD|nr:restriction endonuclease subunit S [Bacillus sp. F56]
MSKKKKAIEELLEEVVVSEEGQPFEAPNNWAVVKTNTVVDVRDGTHDTPAYQEEGIPLITSKNLKNGKLDFTTAKFISEESHLEIAKRSNVEVNDILFAMIGTIGNPVLIEQISQEFSIKNVALFKPNIQKLDSKYFYYYLQSPTYMNHLKNNEKGSTQKFVPLNVLRNAPLYFPPINEQKRIAEKVERLLAKIEEAKMLIEEAKETVELQRAAILDKAFRGELGTNVENEESIINLLGKDKVLVSTENDLPKNWVYVKLGNVAKFQGGSQPPKSVFKGERLDDYIRLVQIRDFKSDKYKTYIPKELAKRTFGENDVMIGRYGPPVFQILRGLSGAYNVALMKATPIKELMDNDFLYYLLQAPFIQNPVIRESHRTAGQTGVRKELIEDFSIGLPPLSEQKRIAEKVANLLKKFEVEQELVETLTDNLAIIKQSILSKAFRGELGTNDPREENAIELLKEVLQEQVQ